MKVLRFVRQRGVSATPAMTLHNAARTMRTFGLSCLPVIRGGSVVAVITEHDLVRAMALCDQPCSALVADYMCDGSATTALDDDITSAILKMLAVGCIDLPVVDRGQLIGMVSARELLAAQAHLEGISV